MAEELIFDAWTSLSFKRAIGGKTQGGQTFVAPSWVGDHARRLRAYTMLQAFVDNSGRLYLAFVDEQDKVEHREYGDAALIRDSVLAALLGEDQSIRVKGADAFNGKIGDDATPDEKAASEEAKPAHDLEEWFDQWALDERLWLKVIEVERDAVGLGDGVYTLGWSDAKGRPRLRVWDPGFYFPVLDDGNEDDFPERVHVAWEMSDPPPGKRLVRRITWELKELPDGETRNYEWNEKPSTHACYQTDAVWEVSSSQVDPDDFSGGKAVYEVDDEGNEIKDLDLLIDFIPVVHMPNTVALKNHFGKSTISTVLQALDDLANADTDLQAAGATAAKPISALSGSVLDEDDPPEYKPGAVWEIGSEGALTVLDTSTSLDALLKYVDALLKRISINARLPEAVLGRVAPNEVPSGLALALSFGPLRSMVEEMRLVRAEKYPLLLKFAHRIAIAGKMADVPKTYVPTAINFGSFLPQDQSGEVELVTSLLAAKAISLETAIAMLVEVGIPIEDAAEEVRKIESRDFAAAVLLLDALGDEQAVADFLHRKLAALQGAGPVPAPGDQQLPPPGPGAPPVNLPATGGLNGPVQEVRQATP